MRDIVVLLITVGSAFFGFMRPWMGVLALAMFAYLNPHRYAWGFSRDLPVFMMIFGATALGMILNNKDREPFPWTRETKLFLLLLLWFTLTTFWEPDFPGPAKEQWIKVMKIYVGIFPTFWLINSRERLRWLVITIALSFGLVGLKGGIFALAKGFQHRVWGPDNTFYGGNNEIALALNMTLPLILLSAKEVENRKAKLFFYAVFFFSVCSIISSWSRGGLLSLCAVLGALVLLGRRKWLSIPILAIALMVAVPNLPEEWFGRMKTIETYEDDASAQNRLTVWRYGFEKALQHPLNGGGFQTFRDALTGPHSAYFGIMGEHGFLAFGMWLSLLFGTMVALGRLRIKAFVYDNISWVQHYARAIQISLLGYAVGGAFLEVGYWDYFYHLVVLCVLLKVIIRKEIQQSADMQAI
ncbi:MAG: putative O-glycosylation ligase, exosortase A system-associated [Desulfuromonadales bacterium]|nr:MAG: putative O-glycosylation ligase, exosortase A system-associated [Desulfuromonadales bacterium]